MKRYISHNIKYLIDKNNLTQTSFAELFDIKTATVNTYTRQKSEPKVELIQRICSHFLITIDDFINRELRDVDKDKERLHPDMDEALQMQANEKAGLYGLGPVVESLKAQICAKDKVIQMLEREISHLRAIPSIPTGEINGKLARLIDSTDNAEQLEAAIATIILDLTKREAVNEVQPKKEG